MRKKLSALMITLLVLSMSITAYAGGPEASGIDTYFENGIIYTADANDSIVEALAVKDGKIVFAGSANAGQAYKHSAKDVVNLQGDTMLPGFIDGHIHTVTFDAMDFNLTEAESKEEILKIIEDAVKSSPNQDTYFGMGLNITLFDGEELEKGPRKDYLDKISPDKPIAVYSNDGHSMWFNSKAFEFLNITTETQAPKGGVIIKDENGELWGILQDAAMALAGNYPLDQKKAKESLVNYMAKLNTLGFTGIMTPSGNGFAPIPVDIYKNLEDNNMLSMRVFASLIITEWDSKNDIKNLKEASEMYNNELLKVISGKFFLDGVVDNETALLLEPYTNKPGYYGAAGWDQENLNEAVTSVLETGLSVHMHSIGDGATRMGLDAIEYGLDRVKPGDYRNALTHLQLLASEDIKRFGTLDVIAVANPYWHLKEPFYWETKAHGLIGERAEKMYPMKSFLDAGVKLVFASDFPVSSKISPFIAIETGITRNISNVFSPDIKITDMDDPTYLLWKEERVDLIQMLRGYTIDAAYAVYAEDEIGSLEVGKSADMIVINQNLFEIDVLDISSTKVLETYLCGDLVYSAAQ